MKPFFYHNFEHSTARLNHGQRRGYTCFFEQDPDNPHNLLARITWCSARDAFCRREGRSQVMLKKSISINKRDLPKFLATAHMKWEDPAQFQYLTPAQVRFVENTYNYMLKYVI